MIVCTRAKGSTDFAPSRTAASGSLSSLLGMELDENRLHVILRSHTAFVNKAQPHRNLSNHQRWSKLWFGLIWYSQPPSATYLTITYINCVLQSRELDQKIQDVYKRIQTERKVLEAAQLLRQATNNPGVLRDTDVKIREGERNISYFEDTLRELHARKSQQSQREDQSRSGGSDLVHVCLTYSSEIYFSDSDPSHVKRPHNEVPTKRVGHLDDALQQEPSAAKTSKTKTYTTFDLVKADTLISTAKVSRMLHQLEFKLQVEMQYKKGIDKMAKLYQADGDKKSRADAESKKVESEKKIQLLQSALKRYKNLHILDDVVEEEEGIKFGRFPPLYF